MNDNNSFTPLIDNTKASLIIACNASISKIDIKDYVQVNNAIVTFFHFQNQAYARENIEREMAKTDTAFFRLSTSQLLKFYEKMISMLAHGAAIDKIYYYLKEKRDRSVDILVDSCNNSLLSVGNSGNRSTIDLIVYFFNNNGYPHARYISDRELRSWSKPISDCSHSELLKFYQYLIKVMAFLVATHQSGGRRKYSTI